MNRNQKLVVAGGGAVAAASLAVSLFPTAARRAAGAERQMLAPAKEDYVAIAGAQKVSLARTVFVYPESFRDVHFTPITSYEVADQIAAAWIWRVLESPRVVQGAEANPYFELAKQLQKVAQLIARRVGATNLDFEEWFQRAFFARVWMPGTISLAGTQPTFASYPPGRDGAYLTFSEARAFWDGIFITANEMDAAETAYVQADWSTLLGYMAGEVLELPENFAHYVEMLVEWMAKLVAGAVGGAVKGFTLGALSSPWLIIPAVGAGGGWLYRKYR